MSLAVVMSRACVGVDAPPVRVEVSLAGGLPRFLIVGLPEAAVRESKDRVRAAIVNAGFEFPDGHVTVNLAPADLPKGGGRFDLPIAVGVLAASDAVPKDELNRIEICGELSLGGDVRAIRGALPVALASRDAGRAVILPAANAAEATRIDGVTVYAPAHLMEIADHLHGRVPMHPATAGIADVVPPVYPDLADVRGQAQAKRALEIAAAGGHSLLMSGPPGTGKSMLAVRLPGILPPMSEREAIESAAIASISHCGFCVKDWGRRPFRAPHHTASGVALVGGGSHPRPGEISLAHCGVLFLDELPEFSRTVLEVLREPLESGHITISRAAHQADFPARFQFIAAMNPCPCGHLGDPGSRCRCGPEQIQRYRSRISGPLLDRIDIHVHVTRPDGLLECADGDGSENSATVAARVAAARAVQVARTGHANALMTVSQTNRFCAPNEAGNVLLRQAVARMGLSGRGLHRVLRVARTIADLAHARTPGVTHIGEALALRSPD